MSNIARRKDLGLGATADGGSSGSFASHKRAQASAPPRPTDNVQETVTSSQDAQNPAFSYQSIRDQWPTRSEIHGKRSVTQDGTHLTQYRIPPAHQYDRPLTVTLDECGDVAEVREFFPGPAPEGTWLPDEDAKDELQHKIRLRRLSAMNVQIAGVQNDGGYGGNQFVGALAGTLGYVPDAAQVSKLVRRDVKRAIEYGALDPGTEVRVRTSKYSLGQAVEIKATVPKGTLRKREPRAMSDADLADWRRLEGHHRSITAQSVDRVLSAIGNQWNRDDSNSMVDYFDSDYHLSVQLREAE